MSRQSPRCGAGESALTWSYRGAADRFEVPGRAEVWGTVKASTGRGLATGDIRLDGDVDLVVANCHGPARTYLHRTEGDPWPRINLAGSGGNTAGFGSRVRPCGDDGTCTWRRIHRDSGYLSLSEPVAFLGLRDSATPIDIEADRDEGGRERFAINATGTKLALVRGEGTALH
ncbi:MAG: hypothetical protein OXC19_00745 [Bryobacterales bacterium]|nr:hypothetical protein [Bryobacterales bacterium]